MTTDYNKIAEQYREVKGRPWRSLVEEYSMLQLIGPVAGLKVVDLACGEGFFTRKLRQLGAASIVGTDVSHEMIKLATEREQAEPLGIDYLVEDVRAEGPGSIMISRSLPGYSSMPTTGRNWLRCAGASRVSSGPGDGSSH